MIYSTGILNTNLKEIKQHINLCKSKIVEENLQNLFNLNATLLCVNYTGSYTTSLISSAQNPNVTFPSFAALVSAVNEAALKTLGITENALPTNIQAYISRES